MIQQRPNLSGNPWDTGPGEPKFNVDGSVYELSWGRPQSDGPGIRASAMIHFSSEESFGLTFAEAIAQGLYLFASDVGAIRDIAKGVERVQIFDLKNWDGLKNSVRQPRINERLL